MIGRLHLLGTRSMLYQTSVYVGICWWGLWFAPKERPCRVCVLSAAHPLYRFEKMLRHALWSLWTISPHLSHSFSTHLSP